MPPRRIRFGLSIMGHLASLARCAQHGATRTPNERHCVWYVGNMGCGGAAPRLARRLDAHPNVLSSRMASVALARLFDGALFDRVVGRQRHVVGAPLELRVAETFDPT